jgi:hypothetical protein
MRLYLIKFEDGELDNVIPYQINFGTKPTPNDIKILDSIQERGYYTIRQNSLESIYLMDIDYSGGHTETVVFKEVLAMCHQYERESKINSLI